MPHDHPSSFPLSHPRPRPLVRRCGSRPDVLDHEFVQLRHQLVGARSRRRLDLADAAKRLSGQRNPADQHRDRRHPDRNPAWPDHRPRHGARHVLPLLPHHHQHPPGLRIGADPDKRHDLDGRRPDRLRGDHDVPAVVGLLRRAGGRDAGRRMGHRHGAHPLRQRRQGDRPRRHGDRRSDHSRHPHHRPRPHRGRTLPQPHQPGDRFHPDARPDRDGRQQRQGRRRHLRLFAGGGQRNRVSHLRIGFGRRLVGLAGDARRRDDRHGDPAAVDPRRHPRHAETPDRLDRPVLLAKQDPGVLVAASEPLSDRDPELYAAVDQRRSSDHLAIALEPEFDRRPQRQSGPEQERSAAVDARLDFGCGLLPRLRPPQRPHALARERHADRQHAELRGPVAVPAGRHRAPLHLLELIARQAQDLCRNRRRSDLAGRQRRHPDRHVHRHGWRRHDGEAVPGAELHPDPPAELRRQSLPDRPELGRSRSAA